MKENSWYSVWINMTVIIIGMAVFSALYGCDGSPKSEADQMERYSTEFSQYLAEGRYDSVDSLLTVERKVAIAGKDSDLWCNTKVQEAVLNYYLNKPDLMLSAIDSADSYLSHKPETRPRLLMHHKVLQAKGTVFTQYYFNPDSAIHYLRKGADLAKRAGDHKAHALALANTADGYKTNSQLDLAAEFYHRAILEADTAGFQPEDYISLYGGLATVYTGLHDFENSGIWWKKTMELWPKMIPFEKFNNLNNFGTDYYYHKDYQGALKTFRRLDTYLDSLPDAEWEKNFVAINLSDCYLHLGQADSVAEMLPKALRYFSDVQPNPVAVSYLHTLQMRRAALIGNNAEADRLIADHPYSDTLRPEMQLLRLEFLSDFYTSTGRSDSALKYYRLYDHLQDSLRSRSVTQDIAANRMAYERDTEMLRMKAYNAEQDRRILVLLNTIAIILLILLITIGLILYNRRRARLREEKMIRKISDLHTEAMRSRITPHFIYNALNHEIRNRNAARPSRLEAIVSLLRQQQFVVSELVTTLASELEFTDNYISIQSDNLEGRFIYTLKIADNLDPNDLKMPSMLIQILVENAFKHAFPALPPEETCRLEIKVEGPDPKGLIKVSVFNTAPASDGIIPDRQGTGLRIIMETLSLIHEREQTDIFFDIDLKYQLTEDATGGCLAYYLIPFPWMKISTQ